VRGETNAWKVADAHAGRHCRGAGAVRIWMRARVRVRMRGLVRGRLCPGTRRGVV